MPDEKDQQNNNICTRCTPHSVDQTPRKTTNGGKVTSLRSPHLPSEYPVCARSESGLVDLRLTLRFRTVSSSILSDDHECETHRVLCRRSNSCDQIGSHANLLRLPIRYSDSTFLKLPHLSTRVASSFTIKNASCSIADPAERLLTRP